MRYVVCAVRDSAADVFGVPMFLGSIGQAIRSFSDEVGRKADDNMLYRHPGDFELFQLGHYNDSLAVFELLDKPKSLIRGVDCIKE